MAHPRGRFDTKSASSIGSPSSQDPLCKVSYPVVDKQKVNIIRPLSATGIASRISLAKDLADLICLLSSCKGPKCSDPCDQQDLATLSPCLVIIKNLFDGSDDEVTSEVRRRTYVALTRIIRHHSGKSLEGWEDAENVIFRGMKDKERSVRLSAG